LFSAVSVDLIVFCVVNKIAVIVENKTDRELMARVLGHKQCTYFDHNQSFENSTHHFDAIVVAHRRSARSAIPSLPSNHQALRLIVLSDCMGESQVVCTLQAGAHHYINILESERVLVARLGAALRLHSRSERRVLDVSPFTFQVIERTVYRDKRRIALSPREFELAYYLFDNRDRVILDAELMTGVWTLPTSIDTRRIDTAICRVRSKLGLQLKSSSWTLVRLRRKGYKLLCQLPEESTQDIPV